MSSEHLSCILQRNVKHWIFTLERKMIRKTWPLNLHNFVTQKTSDHGMTDFTERTKWSQVKRTNMFTCLLIDPLSQAKDEPQNASKTFFNALSRAQKYFKEHIETFDKNPSLNCKNKRTLFRIHFQPPYFSRFLQCSFLVLKYM